jgi:hypothetical protein
MKNGNGYQGRYKGWGRRFNGIAASYLPNDVGWFRALNRLSDSAAKPASLLAPAISA